MTEQEIKEMRDRCEKATPGPWESGSWIIANEVAVAEIVILDDDAETEGNSSFIANARADLPRALNEIERLTQDLNFFRKRWHDMVNEKEVADLEIERLRAVLEWARPYLDDLFCDLDISSSATKKAHKALRGEE